MFKNKLTNSSLDLKASIYKRISNPLYLIFVALTAVGAYGFYLANPSPSIDWLSYDRYYNGLLFGQGRFTATIVEKLLMLGDCPVWFEPMLGLVCFIIGSLILLAIFDGFTEYKSIAPSIVFTCTYISFPLLSEYFIYNGAILTVGGCTVLFSLAIYFSIKYKDFIRSFLLPTVLIIFVVSWYECLVLPYIGAVFGILLLHIRKNGNVKFKELISLGLPSALIAVIGVFGELFLGKLLIKLFSIELNLNARTGSSWQISFESVKNLIFSYMCNWFAMVFCNPAFTVLFIVVVTFLVITVIDTVKSKNFSRFAVHIGMLIPVFAMTFYRCGGREYRTEQGMPFFVAFVCFYIALMIKDRKSVLKRALSAAFVFLLIIQVGAMNKSFWINNLRYEEEKNVVLNINSMLSQNCDLSKPVVFIGNYTMSDSFTEKITVPSASVAGRIYNFFTTSQYRQKRISKFDFLGKSYINWSILMYFDFDAPCGELYKFCDYIGVTFKHCTVEQFENAKKRYADLPAYPSKACFEENDEYIVVKLK
ncbi:MAG: glucosyltransferase domain-containing protein [Acutalibacteraceae bacterium]